MEKDIIELLVGFLNLIATSILGYMVYRITKKSQELSEDVSFHQLFRDFNQRYTKVNNTLNHLELKTYTLEELKKNEVLYNDVLSFLNLCAEEYFWYKKGRIKVQVWTAWDEGMNYWFNNITVLQDVWEDEIEKNGCKSYYIKDKYEFFKFL